MKIIYEGEEMLKGFEQHLLPSLLEKIGKNLDVYVADGDVIINERRQHEQTD